ncbi:5-formyltetrahydrofolate cyclo-ligase [Siphonobacter sp. SORGH_AS_0500]|uniref:5-formyltetrahydrofolate cyclo-ligase n=1 Tax=Siphonobacter sp. SORGH_AS_0500 TaxID=1864824 RepID=UPI00285E5B70|nr:5-formyltetrahydrofolate cyclo-ligase [Siphonobacter sp. SORGH_AS_0500]MDR6193122.1 5-formyltetrahydrofolate cyclo-ligase [Siphonobacter sp. SORGH_AS_0500]
MTKAELRKEFRQKRQGLTDEELVIHSQAIAQHLILSSLVTSIHTLHVFLPIRKKKEVDMYEVIHRVQESYPQINIVVSRSNPDTRRLTHYLLTETTEIVENQWGIPEPVPGTSPEIADAEIDAVLIPLMAFDLAGNRVGYGMGFYDRFLSRCRQEVQKIGVSFFEPVPLITDITSDDVPLTACITPQEIWHFMH